MRLALGEAFDLSRTRTVTVGPRAYAVPPLTFGRLDRLMRAPRLMRTDVLAAFKFEDRPVTTAKELGAALAAFPVDEFAPAAEAAIPGMTADEWREHGDPFTLLELVAFFHRVHDWPFIRSHLYGDGTDHELSDAAFTAAILSVARALGAPAPDVLELRAEGFFACVDALEHAAKEAAQTKSDGIAEALANGELADGTAPRAGGYTDLDRQIWSLDHPGEDLPAEMRPRDGG